MRGPDLQGKAASDAIYVPYARVKMVRSQWNVGLGPDPNLTGSTPSCPTRWLMEADKSLMRRKFFR
jgi:hypothetical protein